MGINVTATNTKIWRKDFKTKDGREFYRYTASVSKKDMDGNWVASYIPVFFSKKAGAPEKIENGALCNSFEGFMSVEVFKDKEGHENRVPSIVIMSADFEGNVGEDLGNVDNFEQAEEDIPF